MKSPHAEEITRDASAFTRGINAKRAILPSCSKVAVREALLERLYAISSALAIPC